MRELREFEHPWQWLHMDFHNTQVLAYTRLADGELKELATARVGPYRVSITDDHSVWYYKNGQSMPVRAGAWMDWAEKHWDISPRDYRALNTGERAGLEAKEQLRYVEKEFAAGTKNRFPFAREDW